MLACAIDVRGKEKTLDTVPIVEEFSEYQLGIFPSWYVDFAIKLKQGTGLISKPPYRMAACSAKRTQDMFLKSQEKGQRGQYRKWWV